MSIILLMYVLGSAIFLLAIAGHIYVQFLLRPGKDSDLDNYCPEFEDTHPDLVRYHKWYRFTIAAAALGAALIFIALAI